MPLHPVTTPMVYHAERMPLLCLTQHTTSPLRPAASHTVHTALLLALTGAGTATSTTLALT
eukprot:CAMPEP_0202870864 /NCGR_PEP_ID=MMETSP1391-20130828/17038_1 /ASSEMBLY_ACC=CAM_ASM_000867 /TAXON_ID=1034604 /ORGANISM="Chlamydomonas leiostraca, Strain SAG 11-49" /LENGTH=60 /DNA_ID=CAMNT_0049551521 /DNA_START=520 /DNA_END=698 /DNA_ORIENTATION=-